MARLLVAAAAAVVVMVELTLKPTHMMQALLLAAAVAVVGALATRQIPLEVLAVRLLGPLLRKGQNLPVERVERAMYLALALAALAVQPELAQETTRRVQAAVVVAGVPVALPVAVA